MINYYKILDIDKKLSEEQLKEELKRRERYISRPENNKTSKEKIESAIALAVCHRFSSTLRHYGSKEKYDRALSKNVTKKDIRINKNKNTKVNFKKIALAGSLIGVVVLGAGTIKGIKDNYDIVDVPIYECDYEAEKIQNNLIDKICREIEYDGNFKIKRDDVLKILVANEDVPKIEEKKEIRQNPPSCDYIVQANENIYNLRNKFFDVEIVKDDPNNDPYMNPNLPPEGTHIKAYVLDEILAKKLQAEYDKYIESKKPIDWKTYTPKPGETLPDVAFKLGTTCNILIKYNDNITDTNTVYAGVEVKAPIFAENYGEYNIEEVFEEYENEMAFKGRSR